MISWFKKNWKKNWAEQKVDDVIADMETDPKQNPQAPDPRLNIICLETESCNPVVRRIAISVYYQCFHYESHKHSRKTQR